MFSSMKWVRWQECNRNCYKARHGTCILDLEQRKETDDMMLAYVLDCPTWFSWMLFSERLGWWFPKKCLLKFVQDWNKLVTGEEGSRRRLKLSAANWDREKVRSSPELEIKMEREWRQVGQENLQLGYLLLWPECSAASHGMPGSVRRYDKCLSWEKEAWRRSSIWSTGDTGRKEWWTKQVVCYRPGYKSR